MPCDGVTVCRFTVADESKRELLTGAVVASLLANYLPVKYPEQNVNIGQQCGDYLSFYLQGHQVTINQGAVGVTANRYDPQSVSEADAIGADLQELLDIAGGQLLQARLYTLVKQQYAVIDEEPGQRAGTIRLTISI